MAYLLLYVNNCEIMTQISARKSEDLESLVHQNRSSADVAFVLAPVFGLSLAAERLTKPRDFMLHQRFCVSRLDLRARINFRIRTSPPNDTKRHDVSTGLVEREIW
jgi:hypothetical protein